MTTPQPARPPRRSGGFFGWLLTIIVAVGLSLAAGGAAAFYFFNYRPETPAELATTRVELAALRSEQQALQTQLALEQQNTNNVDVRANDNRERLDAIVAQVATMQSLAAELRTSISLDATTQADTRDRNATVVAFGSEQEVTRARLAELERKTGLLTTFVNGLGSFADNVSNSIVRDISPTPSATAFIVTPPFGNGETVTPTTMVSGMVTLTPTATP